MKIVSKLKFLILFCVLVVTLQGCKKVKEQGGGISGDTQSITVIMPSVGAGVVTRGALSEVAIKNAYIIIYAEGVAGNPKPKLAAAIDTERITIGDGNVNSRVLHFPEDKTIVEGDEIHIIINKTLTSLDIPRSGLHKALKISTVATGASVGLIDLSQGLPMYGKGEWLSTGSPVINIKHAVAKVQLKLDYRGGEHVEGTMGATYTTENTSFKLYQLSNIGYMDHFDILSTESEPFVKINNEGDINQPSVCNLIDDDFTGASYILEYPYSQQSVGSKPAIYVNNLPRMDNLAIIMRNRIGDASPSGKGEYLYHRLDMRDYASMSLLDIKNNYHYTVMVREVNKGGYLSATEALNSTMSNVRYDIFVEEEGDGVISNGPYLLNVDAYCSNFSVSSESEVIELAKVNRIDFKDDPIAGETLLRGHLDEYFSVTLDTVSVVITPQFPKALGDKSKSVSVTAKGSGVVAFRYIAKMGSVEHKSNLITLKSNFDTVSASPNGEVLTFNISGLLVKKSWNVVSDSNSWASVTKAVDNKTFSVDVKSNSASKDLRTAKITISNNNDVDLVITITQIGSF